MNKQQFKWYRNPKDLFIAEFSVNSETKRYSTSNLLSFVQFLDKRFGGWRYLNIYYRQFNVEVKGTLRNQHGQIASYTPNWRPTSEKVTISELKRYVDLCRRNKIDYNFCKLYYRQVLAAQKQL